MAHTSASLRKLFHVVVMCCLAFSLTGITMSFGQAPGVPGGNIDEVTNFKGTLKGVARGGISVTRDDGVDVLVAAPNSIANFQFRAQAKLPFLRQGMLVRFSGSFGPGGAAVAPISKVTLFQPVNTKGLAGHFRESFTPGVYPADRRAKPQAGAITKYNVVGNLIGVGGGIMAVRAGKMPLRVPLAEDTVLEIQYNNLNLAKPGDPVSIAGFFQPPDDTRVKAERITITTDRIYGETPDEPPPTRKRRSRRDRPEEGVTPEGGEKPGDKEQKEGEGAEEK